MATECIVQAVYRTTCDRCHAVMPGDWDERKDWENLERRKGGSAMPAPADLCPDCALELGHFMDGKAVDSATR